MNLSEREERERLRHLSKLASTARAILANDVALPQGCVRLAKILFWLRHLDGVRYPVVHEYLQAVRRPMRRSGRTGCCGIAAAWRSSTSLCGR